MLSKNQAKFIKSLVMKKNRREEGLFIAEGPKVVGDLLRGGFIPHSIFTTEQVENWQLMACQYNNRCLVQTITADELQRISCLQHPQQVLAIFHIPATDNFSFSTLQSTLSLALDGIQDPGNLGTIIRIADWFGIDTIFCAPDTADVYNPKVVQATMGSLAHVRIIYTDLVSLLSQANCPIYGTLLDGDNIYDQPLTTNGIIVMGNEGNGISAVTRQFITHKLFIPSYHTDSRRAESLNVAIATAITCAEFKRRMK